MSNQWDRFSTPIDTHRSIGDPLNPLNDGFWATDKTKLNRGIGFDQNGLMHSDEAEGSVARRRLVTRLVGLMFIAVWTIIIIGLAW